MGGDPYAFFLTDDVCHPEKEKGSGEVALGIVSVWNGSGSFQDLFQQSVKRVSVCQENRPPLGVPSLLGDSDSLVPSGGRACYFSMGRVGSEIQSTQLPS